MSAPEISEAPCNRCLRRTRHAVLFRKVVEEPEIDDEGGLAYMETTTYELLECRGCESFKLRSTYQFNHEHPEESYFPPAVTRPTPRWMATWQFQMSHRALHSLFQEVYAALHAGSNRLAMMGARTLIDMVMLDKVGDHGTFAKNLDKMLAAGLISGANRNFLEAAIDAGSAAAHRGHRAEDGDLGNVMDIVENLTQAVYSLGAAADTLRTNTPPRPPPPSRPPPPPPPSPKP